MVGRPQFGFLHVRPQNGRRALAPARPAQPLPRAGDRERRADLGDALDLADVDPEFQRRGADRCGGFQAPFQARLDELPVLAGQIRVMRVELVRQAGVLGKLPQPVGVALDLLARIGEDQVRPAAQAPEQMRRDAAGARVVGFLGFFRLGVGLVGFRLRREHDQPLEQQLEFLLVGRAPDDLDVPWRVRPQIRARQLHVSQGRRQADPPDAAADRRLQPPQQRSQLDAPFGVEHGMQFVDDHAVGRREETRRLEAAPREDRFQGFRRDEQDAPRIAGRPRLQAARHVPVPAMHGNLERLAQALEPPELIVDESLQRADVEQLEAAPAAGTLREAGQQRHKGRFGLAGGRRRRDDHVGVAAQEKRDRLFLDIPEFVPAAAPDPFLDRPCQQFVARGSRPGLDCPFRA